MDLWRSIPKSHDLAKHWSKLLNPAERGLIIPNNRIEFVVSIIACSIGNFTPILVSEKATSGELEYIKKVSKPSYCWEGTISEVEVTKIEIKELEDYSFHNISMLFFTSGTTGSPKGVSHEFSNMLLNAFEFNKMTNLDSQVRMLHTMPMGYMAGLLNTLLSPLIAGGSA